jgi:hypothetical protein
MLPNQRGENEAMKQKRSKKASREPQGWSLNLNIVHPNAAGIDIGNESHYVAVPPDRDAKPVRQFACFTEDLRRMAAWLRSCDIDTVAIAYASHCTSLGRSETFLLNCSLFDNLTPLAFLGGSDPGSS